MTIPIVALCAVLLCSGAAFSIDVGRVTVANRALQQKADLAAISASRLVDGVKTCESFVTDPKLIVEYGALRLRDVVVADARQAVARNTDDPVDAQTVEVVFGTLSRDGNFPRFDSLESAAPADQGCPDGAKPNSVNVRVGGDTPYGFGRALGLTSQHSSRAGTAQGGTLLPPEVTTTTTSPLPSTTTTTSPVANPPVGQFTIGSSTATMAANPASLPLVGGALGSLLCGAGAAVPCSVSTSVLTYQALVLADVDLEAVAAGLGAGSATALAGSTVDAKGLLQATAVAMGCSQSGATFTCPDAASAEVAGYSQTVPAGIAIPFDTLVTGGGLGVGGAAGATAKLSALDIVDATAFAINGSQAVLIPSASVGIPGLASITGSASALDGYKSYYGPAGGPTLTTTQLTLALTANVDVGLGGLIRLTGGLPIAVTAGRATGQLTSITCSGQTPTALSVTATANAADVVVGGQSLAVQVAGVTVATVSFSSSGVGASAVGPTAVPFSLPAEKGVVKTIGTSTLTLTPSPLTATVSSGALPIGVTTPSLTAALAPILSSLAPLVKSTFDTLGARTGAADIVAKNAVCF